MEEVPIPSPRKRKASSTAVKKESPSKAPAAKKKKKSEAKELSPSPVAAKKKRHAKTVETVSQVSAEEEGSLAIEGKVVTDKANKSPAKKKKKKKADHQCITERDMLPKLWDSEASAKKDGSYTFRIASWNVAGLRALMKKEPTALADLCKDHDLDVLCLQETKLQEAHLDDPKLKLRGCLSEAGYDEYWSCSTAKKGYSGTAVFVKQRGNQSKKTKQSNIGKFFGKKSNVKGDDVESKVQPTEVADFPAELVTPTSVSYKIGKSIDDEGRTIMLEFPFATITNVYVPNSGQGLKRLDYRTMEWDKDFLAFQQRKEKERGLPVIWLGDLNIAHKAYDIWNDGAVHLAKQAGVTEQERVSFTAMLDAGYIDAFRKLHPDAKGHYSYWSQRAGNREPNKGLRLDYFVCSPELFSEDSQAIIRDSYMIPERVGSDHAPVVLEIELKKKL